jgi:hypothetical protein
MLMSLLAALAIRVDDIEWNIVARTKDSLVKQVLLLLD